MSERVTADDFLSSSIGRFIIQLHFRVVSRVSPLYTTMYEFNGYEKGKNRPFCVVPLRLLAAGNDFALSLCKGQVRFAFQ
jgi:hypothetical protein